MSDVNQQVYQAAPIQLETKKQNYFISKVCLIASLLFAIIFGSSYVISNFVFLKMDSISKETFAIVGSALLIVSIVFSFIVSYKGFKASIGLIISMIALYMISNIFMFSSFFSMAGNTIMVFALALCSITMFVTGILGFIIKPQTAQFISKMILISFSIYFLISITFSLLSWFVISNRTYEIWQIALTAIIGFIVIGSNIYSIYQLKNMQQFISMGELEQNDIIKLTAFAVFNVLSSIVATFVWILRILMIFKGE